MKTRMMVIVAMIGVIAMTGVAGAGIVDNLVGYWQFENNYLDSTGTNDMQAVSGGGAPAPTFGAGQVGTAALVLSGPAVGWEYARTQNAITSAVTGSNARTLNLWYKPDQDVSVPVASYGAPTVAGTLFELYTLRSDNPQLPLNLASYEGHFWGGAGYETSFNDPDPVIAALGTWHMATLVYDGATTVDVYQNGQPITSYTTFAVLNTTTSPGNDTEDLLIGVGNWGTPFFDGAIDDVALWNRVLSADEVEAIFDAGIQGNDLYAAGAIPEPAGLGLIGLALLGLRKRRS